MSARFSQLSLFLTSLFLLVMSAHSQNPVRNYEKEWKEAETFITKGLPKSALEVVKKIYTLAKKENQDAQVIKALINMGALQAENREDNDKLYMQDIEKEISLSKEPAASVLKSQLAGMYYSYYENHRWQLYSRTNTVDFKKDDIDTWTAEDLLKKISDLLLASIQNTILLQQTKLESWDALITKGNMRHLRPTLFDLLAFRALEFFQNDEVDIKKPAYAFEIDNASAFDPAASFAAQKLSTKDSLSLCFKALQVYQQLISFHLKDTKPDALLDADIARIAFVKEKSVHADKDQLYFNALKHIADQYGKTPAASQALYLMAQWYHEQASTYKPYGDETHRMDRIKARDILNDILAQKDSSEGKINAFNLLREIDRPSLQFNLERVNIPDRPFRSLVSYKNISQLYIRVLKMDETLKKALNEGTTEKYWAALCAANPLRSWDQPLPDTKDLQEHRTEIKIDGLPAGDYFLLMSADKSFNSKKALLGGRSFFVSTISYFQNNRDLFVVNRDNGRPLAAAAVQVWTQKYDYKTSKYLTQKAKLYKTDANGFVRMDPLRDQDNNNYSVSYQLDITYNNERLRPDEWLYDYYYSNTSPDEKYITNRIFLFTDRSIYRPGQTVYFKGIVLLQNTKTKDAAVRKNFGAQVILRDANYQAVDTLDLITNEYGSFSGKFVLPSTGITGSFSIYTSKDGGQANFNVEEYKRPKFYVDYEPIKGTYKVNDKISVTGVAKAYAGNNIDGANVKYRVVRMPRFLYSWYFWRWWQPPVKEMEIAHGETKTDKDGKFKVDFTAIPDLTLDKKFDPVFDYTVYADVTDINGETRSGEQMVSVSYKALMLSVNIPDNQPADSLKELSIRTQNMNGEYEPAVVKVTISKLQEEKRLIRSRFWERPDQFVMNKADYIRFFPHDEYDNETDSKSWEKEKTVFDQSDSARDNTGFSLKGTRFEPGYYQAEIETKDKNGETVKDIRYFELSAAQSAQLSHPSYTWKGQTNNTVEPGKTATVEWGSSGENLFVIQTLTKDNQQQPYSFISLNNEKKTFSFPVTEADRGGFGVNWVFVYHNRMYTISNNIYVPWTNKQLNIEYASFRDKTLPGSEEKWTLKISGYKHELVAAEMLASMYDASLDQFQYHSWGAPYVWPSNYNNVSWNQQQNFTKISSGNRYIEQAESKELLKTYDLLLGDLGGYDGRMTLGGSYYIRNRNMYYAPAGMVMSNKMEAGRAEEDRVAAPPPAQAMDGDGVKDEATKTDSAAVVFDKSEIKNNQDPSVKIRKNFNETAFFLPDLHTDSTGAVIFSFTMPEALTKWKFMALAHTKDAAFGYSEKEIVTQKDLMVQPNAPRFLREGDKMEFSTKIVNLSSKELTGTAELQLIDAVTNQPVDGWFRNMIPNQFFTVAAGQSEAVKFPIEVPYQFNKALVWRIVAKAGDYSDGEENAMPVLTNRMLVTETMPMPVRGNATKNFSFDKLLQSGKSETLQQYKLSVEYTGNPAWYAVQALPYLMEYPYECAEQTWNRYYANSIASHVANSSPKIQAVFNKWKITDTAALMSNLQKNEELKAVLLEETPWVLDAQNEAEQKKHIALLFDLIKMSQELNKAYDKLKQKQSSNGGFVWFDGGPDDRYITQYIITGIGHLLKLNAVAGGQSDKLKAITSLALPYLDAKLKKDYDDLIKYKVNLKTYSPGYTTIQYLYMRSFFPETPVAKASMPAYNYFRGRLQQSWTGLSKYMQGMACLALYRTGDAKTPAAILKSLKETAVVNEEMGMYWKDLSGGWFWYEAPIETQSLLIEAFQEAGKDDKTVDDLKTWLIKNKQTNSWSTTKSTAEACYALLLKGSDWLANEPVVTIKLGNTTISSTEQHTEAGTGYFKSVIDGQNVKPDMGKVSVTVNNPGATANTGVSWGAIYWQYFEDLDKITGAATPLKLVKKLFIETNTDRGPVLTPVNENTVIKVGDKIKVRIELRVDRDMEYVHMKDMRASSLEPVNVLSGYKWQGGLGYYESTRDASTNFFFSYLPKGTYVFEYPLFATHAGNFSNGITTIQCMYAPEFTSHSEGVRINVE